MLYTIIPLEIVLKNADDYTEIKEREIINYHGIIMEATRQNDGRYRIDRLLSTNPMIYLDERFQPGIILKM